MGCVKTEGERTGVGGSVNMVLYVTANLKAPNGDASGCCVNTHTHAMQTVCLLTSFLPCIFYHLVFVSTKV